MKYVVVALARRTRPNVSERETAVLAEFQIADQDFVIHGRSHRSRLEKVHAIQIGHVDASGGKREKKRR